jgi:hypothetical protein
MGGGGRKIVVSGNHFPPSYSLYLYLQFLAVIYLLLQLRCLCSRAAGEKDAKLALDSYHFDCFKSRRDVCGESDAVKNAIFVFD